jgi:hypothetical protein
VATLTSAQRDENRLTDDDRERMRVRVAEAVELHKAAATRRDWSPYWGDVPTYERLAYHALGCSAHDLRDSELREIEHLVTDQLGLTVLVGAVRYRRTEAGSHGCDPCCRCGERQPAGAPIWHESHGDLLCYPCIQAARGHLARPDDSPEPGDHCKDCGRDITWTGPGSYDWVHTS